jgi:UPF0755 protein
MKKIQLTAKGYYLVPAFVCLMGFVGMVVYYFFTGFTDRAETSYVYIDEDDTVDSVYDKLATMGSRHAMTAMGTLMRHCDYGQNIRTGRFAVNPDDGVIRVFRRLKNGQQTPVRITIPESRTIDRLAGTLSKKLMIDSTTIACTLTDSVYCAKLGYTTQTIPALFVPNTYELYWNVDIDRFMQRMKKEHDAFWNQERRTKAEAIGLTPDEVCTLASIIDEETANNAEKPMIAGMYLNRLGVNMPLQADPTVKFALGDFAIRRVRHGMLTTDSPYNTYRYEGLPPGPIKVASIKGIDAVLNRVAHDYLYMCAKEDFSGTHNFATTYKEHQRNAARYAKALNERNVQ